MRIKLSPQRSAETLSVSKVGDTLTINKRIFDFSVIPEGATLPASAVDSDFVIGVVERIEGVLHVCLLLPHGKDAGQDQLFPADILDPPDGPIALPMPEAE